MSVNCKKEVLIAFRSTRESKKPKLSEQFRSENLVVWTLGDTAEAGGFSIPERQIRLNLELYNLWNEFPKVQNQVKRHTSWEIWWCPSLSFVDYVAKENKIQWIQTKIRCRPETGKTLAMTAIKLTVLTVEQLAQSQKILKKLTGLKDS